MALIGSRCSPNCTGFNSEKQTVSIDNAFFDLVTFQKVGDGKYNFTMEGCEQSIKTDESVFYQKDFRGIIDEMKVHELEPTPNNTDVNTYTVCVATASFGTAFNYLILEPNLYYNYYYALLMGGDRADGNMTTGDGSCNPYCAATYDPDQELKISYAGVESIDVYYNSQLMNFLWKLDTDEENITISSECQHRLNCQSGQNLPYQVVEVCPKRLNKRCIYSSADRLYPIDTRRYVAADVANKQHDCNHYCTYQAVYEEYDDDYYYYNMHNDDYNKYNLLNDLHHEPDVVDKYKRTSGKYECRDAIYYPGIYEHASNKYNEPGNYGNVTSNDVSRADTVHRLSIYPQEFVRYPDDLRQHADHLEFDAGIYNLTSSLEKIVVASPVEINFNTGQNIGLATRLLADGYCGNLKVASTDGKFDEVPDSGSSSSDASVELPSSFLCNSGATHAVVSIHRNRKLFVGQTYNKIKTSLKGKASEADLDDDDDDERPLNKTGMLFDPPAAPHPCDRQLFMQDNGHIFSATAMQKHENNTIRYITRAAEASTSKVTARITVDTSKYVHPFHGRYEISWWDQVRWASHDMCRIISNKAGKITAECEHLTDFTLLIDGHVDDPLVCDLMLMWMGRVINISSIACLFLLIVVFGLANLSATLPQVRRHWLARRIVGKRVQRSTLQFLYIVTLCLFYLIFTIFSNKTVAGRFCEEFAAISYTLFISCIILTMIQSANVVKNFHSDREMISIMVSNVSRPLVAFIVSFGIPVILATLLYFFTYFYQRQDNFCWVRHDMIAFAIVIPLSLLLLNGIACTIFVARKLFYTGESAAEVRLTRAHVKQRVVTLLLMQLTLGMPWILQYLAIFSPGITAYHYLFTVVNGSQGTMIFALAVYRRWRQNVTNLEEVMLLWLLSFHLFSQVAGIFELDPYIPMVPWKDGWEKTKTDNVRIYRYLHQYMTWSRPTACTTDGEPYKASQYSNLWEDRYPGALPGRIFEQHGENLHIHQASPRDAGVYLCYDRVALSTVRYFYVLHAMTPINGVHQMEKIDGYLERENPHRDMGRMHCSVYKETSRFTCANGDTDPPCLDATATKMYPDTKWQFNWRPVIYRPPNAPLCFPGDRRCQGWMDALGKIYEEGGKTDDPRERLVLRKVPEKPVDLKFRDRFMTNFALAFRWEPWTKCRRGQPFQRREGHCVLQFSAGKKENNENNDSNDSTDWMKHLATLLKLASEGTASVRLYSSLVMSMILDAYIETDCGTINRAASPKFAHLQDFFEQVVYPSIGIPTDFGSSSKGFVLADEWQACFKLVLLDQVF
ncbi:unnamed protein product, partial [Mesorhabditis spiculigera]